MNKIKGIDLVFLYVSNLEESVKFYKNLGMELVYKSNVWAEFFISGTKFSLWKKDGDFNPVHSRIYFAIENIEKYCLDIEKTGVKITFPPTNYFYGTVAEIKDPDGNIIGLYERCDRQNM